MPAPIPQFIYNAVVLKWVDGDTVDLDIDWGGHIHRIERCRLIGIDTPERGMLHYKEATANAQFDAPAGTRCVVKTELDKDDKYGRLLVTIWVGELNVNQDQIDDGFAVPYDGGHKATS
jgi:micrococcal nuclease